MEPLNPQGQSQRRDSLEPQPAPCCPLVPSSKGSAPTPEGEFMAATAPNPALSVTSVRTRSLGDYIFKAQIVLFVSLPAFMRPSVILHTDNISYVH